MSSFSVEDMRGQALKSLKHALSSLNMLHPRAEAMVVQWEMKMFQDACASATFDPSRYKQSLEHYTHDLFAKGRQGLQASQNRESQEQQQQLLQQQQQGQMPGSAPFRMMTMQQQGRMPGGMPGGMIPVPGQVSGSLPSGMIPVHQQGHTSSSLSSGMVPVHQEGPTSGSLPSGMIPVHQQGHTSSSLPSGMVPVHQEGPTSGSLPSGMIPVHQQGHISSSLPSGMVPVHQEGPTSGSLPAGMIPVHQQGQTSGGLPSSMIPMQQQGRVSGSMPSMMVPVQQQGHMPGGMSSGMMPIQQQGQTSGLTQAQMQAQLQQQQMQRMQATRASGSSAEAAALNAPLPSSCHQEYYELYERIKNDYFYLIQAYHQRLGAMINSNPGKEDHASLRKLKMYDFLLKLFKNPGGTVPTVRVFDMLKLWEPKLRAENERQMQRSQQMAGMAGRGGSAPGAAGLMGGPLEPSSLQPPALTAQAHEAPSREAMRTGTAASHQAALMAAQQRIATGGAGILQMQQQFQKQQQQQQQQQQQLHMHLHKQPGGATSQLSPTQALAARQGNSSTPPLPLQPLMPNLQAHAQTLEHKGTHKLTQMAQQQQQQQQLLLQQHQQQRGMFTPPPVSAVDATPTPMHTALAAMVAQAKSTPAVVPTPSARLLGLLKARGAGAAGKSAGPATSNPPAAPPVAMPVGLAAPAADAALLAPPPVPPDLRAPPSAPRTLTGASAADPSGCKPDDDMGMLHAGGGSAWASGGVAEGTGGLGVGQGTLRRKRGRQEEEEGAAAHHALVRLCQQAQESLSTQFVLGNKVMPEPLRITVQAGSHLEPPLESSCLLITTAMTIAPEILTQHLSKLSDISTWGQLRLCVPESVVLGAAHHQAGQEWAEAGAPAQPSPDSCLVVPLFQSADAAYSHPLGCMMRSIFQANLEQQSSTLTLNDALRRWRQTAKMLVQCVTSALMQQQQQQRQQQQAHEPPARPSPAQAVAMA